MASLHLRGTVLPDGTVRDLWTLGDRITFQGNGARAVPGAGHGLYPGHKQITMLRG
ncbi:hypothetical protein [Streptomyces fulvoviolaceus]|uniref:hypothetical protein n=1 Tax=Streptomyces fulvoviolaceus TaxID=285535 RepID=UPI000AAD1488|nr:hypothetical protein [Streptomyces fulvoviolaceus]MCT9079018.1 hypothetical protein [Streptomyces fulvoviolaceus]